MTKALVGLLFAMTTLSAGAQLSHRYDQCISRARKNTVQVNVCVQKEMALQDTRLNEVYHARMTALQSDGEKSALKQDELAWLKKRDAMCRVNGDTVDNICLVRETAHRADSLKR